MANKSLEVARKDKVDEFYTQLNDIETELKHYRRHFNNKVVFCNCDDPYESNFFKYFAMNFNYLGLKKLIATCYDPSPIAYTQLSIFNDKNLTIPNNSRKAYKIEICEVGDENDDGAYDMSDVARLLKSRGNVLTMLNENGDFRSEECVELLKEADIVVTNPPFSLFREYVAQLVEYNKKFLIIGNQNAITYKEIFPLIKDNKIWLGYNNGAQTFLVPYTFQKDNTFIKDGKKYAKFGNICWFTNLDIEKRQKKLTLYKKYNPKEYPKYDNYDAIEVSKVADIPYDYVPTAESFGGMGVPITFLEKYNPEQFEIVKFRKGDDEKDLTYTVEDSTMPYRQTQDYAILQNHYQTQGVTESWASPLHSLINTTLTNLNLSAQQKAKEKGSRENCGSKKAELRKQLQVENESTNDCLLEERCNGIMGVPITFLDKYNPDQFEIIGIDRYTVPKEALVGGRVAINGKPRYARILIRRKMNEN